DCHTDGVRLHRRRQNSWRLGALKRLKYFANVQLRDRTDAALSFAGSNQSPNESLKLDTGRDLRSVGRNLIEIAAAIVIVIEIAEAKFGVDAPGHLAAERTVGLHGNNGTDVKTADIHLAGQIKSLVQIIAAANANVGIGPILGQTVT